MTAPSMARRAPLTGLGIATTFSLTLALGLGGCGGNQEAGDAVVAPEPGVTIPAAGTTAPAGGAAATSTTASAAPAAATAPAATPVKAEGWGTLKGQVVYGGDPPAQPVVEEQGKAKKDPEVCAKSKPILSERLVVDKATKGVKNVFVYIPKPTAVNEEAKSAASSANVVFDQENCTFEPHALGVMAGTKITLKSTDAVNHNINARLSNNGGFNSLIAGGKQIDYKPDSGERQPSLITCDIHPWMQAYWLVLDSPYFATTDEKGNYEIKNVPAGTQKVVVWQEATGFLTAPSGDPVTIKAGDATDQKFTLDPSKVKQAP